MEQAIPAAGAEHMSRAGAAGVSKVGLCKVEIRDVRITLCVELDRRKLTVKVRRSIHGLDLPFPISHGILWIEEGRIPIANVWPPGIIDRDRRVEADCALRASRRLDDPIAGNLLGVLEISDGTRVRFRVTVVEVADMRVPLRIERDRRVCADVICRVVYDLDEPGPSRLPRVS